MNTRKLTMVCLVLSGLVLSACGGYGNARPTAGAPTYADASSSPTAALKGD